MRIEDFVTDIPSRTNGVTDKQYHIWRNMIKKCYVPTYRDYKWRGAKGYTVCEEWRYYSNFKRWFDENYKEDTTMNVDIVNDNDKCYNPVNCKFLKKAEREVKTYEQIEDILEGLEDEYGLFEMFFNRNRRLITRVSAYSGLTYDELKQECAIVFFSNREIMALFLEEKCSYAFSLFHKHLVNSLKDFSLVRMQVKENEDYEREKLVLEKVFTISSNEINIEDGIMMNLELDRLRELYGSESIDSIIEYYDIGCELFAEKYEINPATARKRISRLLNSMRAGEEHLSSLSRE